MLDHVVEQILELLISSLYIQIQHLVDHEQYTYDQLNADTPLEKHLILLLLFLVILLLSVL